MEKKINLKVFFELAKQNGIVHNQSQFAELLQTDTSTMSICLKGVNKKYATTCETLVSRAELALMKAGIKIDGVDVGCRSIVDRQLTDTCSSSGEDKSVIASLIKELTEQRIAKDLQIQRSQDQIDRLITMLEDRGASLHKAQ